MNATETSPSIEAFLSYLYGLDVKLWLEEATSENGDRLRCNGPEDTLTPELTARISARKPEIVEFLKQSQTVARPSTEKIRAIARPENVPLSFAQQRLWFLDRMEPGSPLYNIPAAARFLGELDANALERSFNEIVRRHEVLRTTFREIDGRPVQAIAPHLSVPLQQVDLSSLDKARQDAEVLRQASQEAQQPFDLARGPLLRVTLLRLRDKEHVALLTMHHIVSDAWSMGVLMQEIAALYPAFAAGRPSPLPELPIQYADFAIWQRQQLQGEVLEGHLSYWRKQLGGELPVLQLPSDRPRPRIQTFRGATLSFELPAELTASLRTLSQSAGTTLFMTLLAAFKVLLYRYTSQDDICVGSPIANRNRPEIEGSIGFFVNNLVLRSDLSGNPSFRELLNRVRQVTLDAYDRQDLPFEELVADLNPERDLSHSPLFQVKFALENTPARELALENLTIQPIQQDNPTAKLDLSLDMQEEANGGLDGTFEYNTDLFDEETIAAAAGHFQRLLAGIVAQPDRRLSELSVLTDVERQQILVDWNDTHMDFPQGRCFHQQFEKQAERSPEATALVFQNESLTYAELNRRANQVARYLQTQGVKPEVVVGLCVARSPAAIVGLLGILKAGGAYLPIDPTYPPERLAFVLSDSQVPILLTTQSLTASLPESSARRIYLDADWENIAGESDRNPDSNVTVENLAYLIYTSGSTGTPNGVLVPHAGLTNLTEDKIRTCRVRPDSRVLQFFSLSFDASVPEIVMSLGCGASLHLASQEDLLPGPNLLKLLRDRAITHITVPPSALAALPVEELPALEMVLVGGEAPSPELIARWSNGRRFINAYGPTETTVNASMVACEAGDRPCLRPAANKQFYILDRDLQPVPIGVPGELCVGGVGLARGYLNRPEKTAAAFIPNPFSEEPGSRLYKTGDLACYRRDGRVELFGRLDRQVKIRGFRIELGEVEARVGRHEDVRESVAIVREDRPGEKRLVAYVVPVAGRKPNASELHRFVAEKLPKYMLPAAFVILDAFPLNPNGKLDRKALPAPDNLRPDLAEAFVAPRNETEAALAQIFARVLEVDRVGVRDDFFELGGHSLLATQLIARLLKDVGATVAIADLFEAPTVAGLAERLARSQGAKPATPGAREGITAFFKAEAVLDETIRPGTHPVPAIGEPDRIFLTGATGFLGAFLLHELLQTTQADIYCLVRSPSVESARQKLQTCLESYQLWQEGCDRRIVPVLGDLSKPLLGLETTQFRSLAEQIDVIYHSGAWVHHASPYSLLKASNVLGTQEILRFACQAKVKPVHFMSATSVFAPNEDAGTQTIREGDKLPDRVPWDGYSQSKWVAERLVTIGGDRGIPVCIYRLGRISGHSQTGAFNQNDFLYRLIAGCVCLECIPDDAETTLDIVPVDYASRAIVRLSQQSTSQGKTFHLVHPNPVSANILLDSLRSFGFSIQQISNDRWQTKLLEIAETSPDHPLYPLVPLLAETDEPQPSEATLRFDCQNALDGLAGSAIVCPPIDRSLLNTYFSHLIECGWLKNCEKLSPRTLI